MGQIGGNLVLVPASISAQRTSWHRTGKLHRSHPSNQQDIVNTLSGGGTLVDGHLLLDHLLGIINKLPTNARYLAIASFNHFRLVFLITDNLKNTKYKQTINEHFSTPPRSGPPGSSLFKCLAFSLKYTGPTTEYSSWVSLPRTNHIPDHCT